MAVTISVEDVKKARAYMPVATKETVVRHIAKLIVEIVDNDAGGDNTPLPPIRIENRVRRAQFLNGVLAEWYFGAQYEREKLIVKADSGETRSQELPMCMSLAALDNWLEGHPINQLERLKKDKNVANKVYDILYDFRAFELMLNGAIRDEIEMGNDPALRIAEVLAVQTTPESFKETMELLKEYRDQIGEKENV